MYQQQHDKFLDLYRNKKWKTATRFANDLKREWVEMAEYYDIMLDRIENYKNNDPGEDWDGTYIAETK